MDRFKIADALGGFSAGVAGQLPQWQQQQSALSKERKQALAEDLVETRRLLSLDPARALEFWGGRLKEIPRLRGNPKESQAMYDMMQEGMATGNFDEVMTELDSGIASAQSLGYYKPSSGDGVKFSATTEHIGNGVTVQTDNTGRKIVTDVEGNILTGADAKAAIAEARELDLSNRRDQADIDVSEATRKKRAELKETRNSNFITEITTRNRNGARQNRRISEALTLSSRAADGLTAGLKVKLSRLLPDIDVSDEAALNTALLQLSLDQLQSFKGPTTDFEFGVTERIVGSVTDAREARNAQLKSLSRAAWFNQREYDQFIRHMEAGGNSDNFSFNFGEEVKTKKGIYTLQDLQDTAVKNHMSIQEVMSRLNQ